MAKYMLIMRSTDETWAAYENVDFETVMNEMGMFNDELIQAGVLVATEGLEDAADSVVVDYSSETPVVTDGPYGETKELGLLALLELAAARFPARVGPSGEPILLEDQDQDRRRWDRAAIIRGRAALRRSAGPSGMGPYALQAAIAECHAVAGSVPETDWERIVVLYEALGRIAPSPVVDLNRAVAVAMAHGPDVGLRVVDELVDRGVLAGSHLLPGVRGELLARLGRVAEARGEYLRAAELCGNAAERSVLERKARAVES